MGTALKNSEVSVMSTGEILSENKPQVRKIGDQVIKFTGLSVFDMPKCGEDEKPTLSMGEIVDKAIYYENEIDYLRGFGVPVVQTSVEFRDDIPFFDEYGDIQMIGHGFKITSPYIKGVRLDLYEPTTEEEAEDFIIETEGLYQSIRDYFEARHTDEKPFLPRIVGAHHYKYDTKNQQPTLVSTPTCSIPPTCENISDAKKATFFAQIAMVDQIAVC